MKEFFADGSAPPLPLSLEVMMRYFSDPQMHLSSPFLKQQIYTLLQDAYTAIYGAFGLDHTANFIYTSSGAEAVSLVFHSVYNNVIRKENKNHVVVGAIDDAALIMSSAKLEDVGVLVSMAQPNNRGCITQDSIADVITSRTALVSLSWASGLTGLVHQIEEIALLCKRRGVLLHVDATHVVGKQYIKEATALPDFITFDGQGMHAPRGTGGLFCQNKALISPLISGENETQSGRGGPCPLPLIMALAKSAEEVPKLENSYCTEIARLRGVFIAALMAAYPEIVILFPEEEKLPHIVVAAFPNIHNEMLLYALHKKGVYASIGGGSLQQIEIVLQSSGVDPILAQNAVAFILPREIEEETLLEAAKVIAEQSGKLKRLCRHVL